MGVHDGYCIICGAPFHSYCKIKTELILREIEFNLIYDNKKTKNKPFKSLNINKYIDNNEILNTESFLKNIHLLYDSTHWLNDILIITSENKLLKAINTGNTDFISAEIQGNDGDFYIAGPFFYEKSSPKNCCILCHSDCYDLLLNKLQYKLNFNHVCRKLDDSLGVFNNKNIYGKIAKTYSFEQDFNWYGLLTNITKNMLFINLYNLYFILSPLESVTNEKRILNIWKPIIKNKIRNSPCLSATLFLTGNKLIGNDNNIYVIKKHNKTQIWVKSSI
jgi:hypothetical protein